jgi:hypothetical protein
MTAVYMVRLDSESVSYVMSGASEYVSLPHLRTPHTCLSTRLVPSFRSESHPCRGSLRLASGRAATAAGEPPG